MRHVEYRTIVADPPWEVKAGPRSLHDPHEKSRPLKYPTMTVEEIARLPITTLAAKDAHCYLWTINAYIEASYGIMRAWGFEPSTMLVWAKKPKGRGLGGTYPTFTEYVLFGRRGRVNGNRAPRNWWEWPRRAHSEKPEAFQDVVEAVSPSPYLELFARRQRLGWDTWGNEALNHVELVPHIDKLRHGGESPKTL